MRLASRAPAWLLAFAFGFTSLAAAHAQEPSPVIPRYVEETASAGIDSASLPSMSSGT